MNILLLGGSGYIGSKFHSIYKDTYNITSVDLNLFHKFEYSQEKNFSSFSLENYDVIICLAGHSSVQMCEYSPGRSWVNNVDYFRNLCDNLSNQKLIYASSASVYGSGSAMSSEDSPINFNPVCHYDLQKITIDMIANKYIKEGKNIVGLRFGTVNGASPHTRRELMINSMVYNALTTRKINAKNLHIRRAILGINDLMKCLKIIVENDIECGQYNLSSFNSTVEEIAKTVAEECAAQLIIHPEDAVAYDFEMTTNKFTKETGFIFTDTIRQIVDDLRTNYHKAIYTTRDNDGKFEQLM